MSISYVIFKSATSWPKSGTDWATGSSENLLDHLQWSTWFATTKEGWAPERWGARGQAVPEDWSQCTPPASRTPLWPPAPHCAAPSAMSGWRTPTLCSALLFLRTSSASPAPDKASNSRELVERSIVPVGKNALLWAPMSPGPSCKGRLQPSLLEMWKWKKRETRDFPVSEKPND